MKKIFILTGEASGDKLASKVIENLKKLNSNIEFLSVGGENLKKIGIKSIYDLKDITYLGFTNVILNIFKIKKKSASIVTFLNGKDKKKLSNSNCFDVGKNIAKLHLASKKLKIYRKNSLSVNSWKPLLNKIDKRINKIQKNLIGLMNEELSIIKKNWPKHLSVGIIHSDLFIDNIFFHKNKFYGFIDFYFSANDFLSYDLATCINALCFIKKKGKFILDKNKSYNLIRGYQTVRKLSNSEKLKFNILCRGSALRYLLTRSYDYLNTPKTAIIKIKDPREYIQKLIFHKNVNSFSEYF